MTVTQRLIEDHVLLALSIARQTAQRCPGSELEEIQGDALEWLVILADRYDPARGSFATLVCSNLPWRLIDRHRIRSGRHRVDGNIDCYPVWSWAEATDAGIPPAPAPDDEVMARLAAEEVRAVLRALAPAVRRLALASTVRGGLTAAANEAGVTQAAITHRLRRLRQHFRHLRESA